MKYYVRLTWKESYKKRMLADYGMSAISNPTCDVAISIDDLIAIGLVCRQKGVDIIDLFERSMNKEIVDFLDEHRGILGRIEDLRTQSYCISTEELTRENIEAIVLKLTHHWAKARKYNNPNGTLRCTGDYRYWVSFKMRNEPIAFKNIVYLRFLSDKMYEYALRHVHMKNLLTMVKKGEELFNNLDISDIVHKRFWLQEMTDPAYYLKKWLDAMITLSHQYIYDDVNGCEERVIVPPELVLPVLQSGGDKIEKIRKFLLKVQPIISARTTIPVSSQIESVFRKYAALVSLYHKALARYGCTDINIHLKSTPHHLWSDEGRYIRPDRCRDIDFQQTVEHRGLKYCHTVRWGGIYYNSVGEPYRRHYRSYIFN